MDWGTVVSVLVAIPLFIVGMMVLGGLSFGLAAFPTRGHSGGFPKCPFAAEMKRAFENGEAEKRSA